MHCSGWSTLSSLSDSRWTGGVLSMHDSEVVQQSMTCCLYFLIVGPADGHPKEGASMDSIGDRRRATMEHRTIPRGPEPITIMIYIRDSSTSPTITHPGIGEAVSLTSRATDDIATVKAD